MFLVVCGRGLFALVASLRIDQGFGRSDIGGRRPLVRVLAHGKCSKTAKKLRSRGNFGNRERDDGSRRNTHSFLTRGFFHDDIPYHLNLAPPSRQIGRKSEPKGRNFPSIRKNWQKSASSRALTASGSSSLPARGQVTFGVFLCRQGNAQKSPGKIWELRTEVHG